MHVKVKLSQYTIKKPWIDNLLSLEKQSLQVINDLMGSEYFEGGIVKRILEKLQPDCFLFAGNSLPIRHVSEFMIEKEMKFETIGNRGASGIDGNISTFCGIASQHTKKGFILIGDLTSIHDLTGLFHISRLNLKVVVIILNNRGGGIFKRLPIANYDPPYTDLYKMEYKIEFDQVAKLFGLDYFKIENYDEIENFDIIETDKSILIEIETDAKIHQDAILKIQAKLL